MYQYRYPRPALTVDIVIFALPSDHLKTLLIRRKGEPFAGQWALPGGFMEITETVEEAAQRELAEETGLKNIPLEQIHTFSAVDRDPRERVVSVAHTGLLEPRRMRVHPASDAAETEWFPVGQLPQLAFDHQRIVNMARERLRSQLRTQPVAFRLLPARFSLGQLQRVFEVILDRKLDKRNFRKKMLSTDLLHDLNEKEKNVSRRPARLYRFDKRRFNCLVRAGLDFGF